VTPGLAGFVASGDESGWEDEVAAVFDGIRQTFTLIPEHGAPGTVRRTWFDTFDWRLYRAGLLLEYVPARRGGELRLVCLASPDQSLASQPVTGWRPSSPHPVTDLPDGPLAARIGSIVFPRHQAAQRRRQDGRAPGP
jgi:hypothetical protein